MLPKDKYSCFGKKTALSMHHAHQKYLASADTMWLVSSTSVTISIKVWHVQEWARSHQSQCNNLYSWLQAAPIGLASGGKLQKALTWEIWLMGSPTTEEAHSSNSALISIFLSRTSCAQVIAVGPAQNALAPVFRSLRGNTKESSIAVSNVSILPP